MAKQELQWNTLDQNADNGPADALIEAFNVAKAALEDHIERVMGGPCQFSYRRGEISFARVDRAPAKGKVSLAQFVADQEASGRRA
jgi:hypothetical protein